MSPLVGPRFKCRERADYDLCSECFGKKGSVHGGEAADHPFECIFSPEATPEGRRAAKAAKTAFQAAKMAFKGKGKGKGDCKGARRGSRAGACGGARKGHASEGDEPLRDARAVGRACAGGCGFQATWHRSHCCRACMAGSGKHGPRCEKKAMAAKTASQDLPATAAASDGPCDEAASDAPVLDTFPGTAGDGQQAALDWELCEDPRGVAELTAREQGTGEEEEEAEVDVVASAMAHC